MSLRWSVVSWQHTDSMCLVWVVLAQMQVLAGTLFQLCAMFSCFEEFSWK